MQPSDLESLKSEKYIYLTTTGRKTGRQYTKELWFAVSNGKIYLSHEGKHTDWMKNIAENSSVKAKIRRATFDAKGKVTGNDSSREIGKKALYEKYYGPTSKEVIDDWFELSTVVELTPSSEVRES